MSDFFDSDIIQKELEIINDLQEEIYGKAFQFDSLNREERLEHIDNLSELLEKQRIMYTRLSLSDDPKASRMKAELEKSVLCWDSLQALISLNYSVVCPTQSNL